MTVTVTYAQAIEHAEDAVRAAKRAAEVAREASKASPADLTLRAAALATADDAAVAGRKLAAWRFEEQLDRWVARHLAGDVPADELLVGLAPRQRGDGRYCTVDLYWLAAAHLARAGIAVPRNWRSPVTGEPVHANQEPNPDPSGSAQP